MATSYKYFGRYYHLVIEQDGKDGKKRELLNAETLPGKPALDIKFSTSYPRGAGLNARQGEISVLGLSFETMTKITRLAALDKGRALSERIRVKLDAGYFSSAGWSNIFDGIIWNASLTSPPEMWLNMQVSEINPFGPKLLEEEDRKKGKEGPFNSKKEYHSIVELMNDVATFYGEKEGIDLKFKDKRQDKSIGKGLKEFKAPTELNYCTLKEALTFLSGNLANNWMFLLTRASGGTSGKMARVIEGYAKDDNTQYDSRNIIVDADHGLLSVSGISVLGGEVTTFLNKSSDAISHLKLTSKLNPHANGRYFILNTTHKGHYEGNEWYTTYNCTAREKKPQKK